MIDAETYDAYLVPVIFEPWSRDLIKRAQVWKGDKVLDVVTRSGILACRLAASGAAIAALDTDPALLARAKQRATDEGVGVKWMEGEAARLPFRQPAFDLVTCHQGLQTVGDAAAVAREMRRVINPGGRAVVACWTRADQQPALGALAAIAVRCLGAAPDTGLWSGGALGDEAALKKLLEAAKFFAIAVETATRQVRIPEPERFVRTTFSALGDAAPGSLDEAVAEGVAALESFVEDGTLVCPMTSVIAVGRVKT